MAGQKRSKGRGYAGGAKRAKKTKTPSSYAAGYARTSGYYGRFSGPGAELKFHDLDVDDAVVAAAGTIQTSGTLNAIAQGTTESTRIGRACTIKGINWRYQVGLPASAAKASGVDTCRLILYMDKQCNGATAAVTDILEAANYQSFNNLANSHRFKVLMDRSVKVAAEAGGGDGTTEDYAANHVDGSFYKKCNIPLEFDSTTGAITELRSNNLGALFISSGGLCSVDSKIRLRFVG